MKCLVLFHILPQIVAAPHLRALRSNLGEKDSIKLSKASSACISLHSRSYIDSAKKLGQKFDLVIDDGRARVGVSLK